MLSYSRVTLSYGAAKLKLHLKPSAKSNNCIKQQRVWFTYNKQMNNKRPGRSLEGLKSYTKKPLTVKKKKNQKKILKWKRTYRKKASKKERNKKEKYNDNMIMTITMIASKEQRKIEKEPAQVTIAHQKDEAVNTHTQAHANTTRKTKTHEDRKSSLQPKTAKRQTQKHTQTPADKQLIDTAELNHRHSLSGRHGNQTDAGEKSKRKQNTADLLPIDGIHLMRTSGHPKESNNTHATLTALPGYSLPHANLRRN